MTSILMATQDNAVRQQAIVSDRPSVIASDRHCAPIQNSNFKIPNKWSLAPVTFPRFGKEQRVWFVGGVGTILYCRPESGTWIYAVEMELGPEPDMGRVGSETTILLQEADIHKVMK